MIKFKHNDKLQGNQNAYSFLQIQSHKRASILILLYIYNRIYSFLINNDVKVAQVSNFMRPNSNFPAYLSNIISATHTIIYAKILLYLQSYTLFENYCVYVMNPAGSRAIIITY